MRKKCFNCNGGGYFINSEPTQESKGYNMIIIEQTKLDFAKNFQQRKRNPPPLKELYTAAPVFKPLNLVRSILMGPSGDKLDYKWQ